MSIQPGAEQLWRKQEGAHGDGQTEAWPRGQCWMVHHASRMCWIASVCCCTAENCWAKPSTVSPNCPAWEMGASRKRALLVEVPREIAVKGDSADYTMTPTRNKTKMNGFVEISTLLIHSAPKQKSNEWMHLSPFYTHMHGERLRCAKSTSQFYWRFLLKSEMIGASRALVVTDR